MLADYTKKLKELHANTKLNILSMGKLLYEIKESEIYLEKYQTFTEYLESEDFNFSKRHAYNFITVYQQFGSLISNDNVQSLHKVGWNTMLEICRVPDKEVRNQLVEEAVSRRQNIEKFRDKVHRSTQRLNETVIKTDSPELKCQRLLEAILSEIGTFLETKAYLTEKIQKTLNFSLRFPQNACIQSLSKEVKERWTIQTTQKSS